MCAGGEECVALEMVNVIAVFGGHPFEFKFELILGFADSAGINADCHSNYNCKFNVYLAGLNRTSEPVRFGSRQKPLSFPAGLKMAH